MQNVHTTPLSQQKKTDLQRIHATLDSEHTHLLKESCEMFRLHAIGFAEKYTAALQEIRRLKSRIADLESDEYGMEERRARKGEWCNTQTLITDT